MLHCIIGIPLICNHFGVKLQASRTDAVRRLLVSADNVHSAFWSCRISSLHSLLLRLATAVLLEEDEVFQVRLTDFEEESVG